MDQVELSSRLSAFDSFLFLANEQQDQGEGLNHDSLPTDEDHEGSKSESSITYESNVRCIPGGPEERKDMQDRLSVFDKYMFLLDNSKHVNGVKNTGKRKKTANASGTTKIIKQGTVEGKASGSENT
eukprot:scaffold1934_cov76-Cyclotella_meneghiniana.AAC.9